MKINDYNQVWDIWVASKEKLHAYVMSRFKNKELATDVTQEVLLKIHKSCCSDKEIKNLNAWLYQIAHNASLDIIKKDQKHSNYIQSKNEDASDDAWTQLSFFLEPLINQLDDKYSIPLKMADLENIPQQEIADKLKLNLSATKSRIQRARKQLKNEIQSCFKLEMDKNGIPINVELKDSCISLQDFKNKN